MKNNVLGVGLILFFSVSVFAQEALVGKYSGAFTQPTRNGDQQVGLTLEISSVEGGAVKGTAVRMAPPGRGGCRGEYPVEGTVKGNELTLKATEKGGPAGDCNVNLKLTVEGNKLVGTMGQFKTTLSK